MLRAPRTALLAAATAIALSASGAPLRALAQPGAVPRDGIEVGEQSPVARLVSAEQLERDAATQYRKLLGEAASKGALAPDHHPQLQRLRRIAARIVPHAGRFNARAPKWQWEINLIGSKQVNAFCMPGGKIAFFTGILETLKLTDDEVAVVMAHEVAHALREHGRERAAKSAIAQGVTIGASVLSQLLGYGDLGGFVAQTGAKFTMLAFSREDETEADLVGMDLAARAGFDPRAGIKLWEKMAAVGKNQPPQWASTHPSHGTRIEEIRRNLDAVMPLYARAVGKPLASLPPYRSNAGAPVQ
ncbi:MAG TPA: M48 family metallopeptidase [Quisquiliibacterium sp.]|nr:M48 family metallopeptidase [Quisquiliibacterium sp.]